MSNSDFRIQIGALEHPKLIKTARRLGPAGVVSTIKIWDFAAHWRPDGDLSGMSIEDLEIAAGWSGLAGELVKTLLDVRLLDGCEGSLKVHDWHVHNPWAAGSLERSEHARKAAVAKHERTRRKTTSDNAASTNGHCSEHAASTNGLCPSPDLSASSPSPDLSVSSTYPNPEPSTTHHNTVKNQASAVLWDAFSKVFPKNRKYSDQTHQQSLSEAYRYFINETPENQVAISKAAKHFADSDGVARGIGIHFPETFLRGKKWRDWITPET